MILNLASMAQHSTFAISAGWSQSSVFVILPSVFLFNRALFNGISFAL